ncbi:hypothetical protein AHiyo4_00320 [Arthrobacter sp. Hiyo4]|nr:hypothetical protein AHiyo4_00320 [Arthrobacter sp. Hiyo4]
MDVSLGDLSPESLLTFNLVWQRLVQMGRRLAVGVSRETPTGYAPDPGAAY